MFNDNLRVLKLLNEKKVEVITQREIARELNISLGKVNGLLKSLVNFEFIEIIKINQKNSYKLTNKGKKELEKSVKKIKELRINIHDEIKEDNKVETAIILAAGYKKGINFPLGFIKINNESVIEKMIKILRKNLIKRIIIVAGYKKEYYLELEKNNDDIEVVINDDFEKTGSMKSLSLCSEIINEDFILIENDLIFEEKAIVKLLENKNKDCVLITNITGSGHEVFVEVRENHLFKFSKDIHDFNKIDGEIIGITKISEKLYKLMLKEFSLNKNPYINYEHTMLDITRYYKVFYEKIDKLKWKDISIIV